jgi:hypothetical protein
MTGARQLAKKHGTATAAARGLPHGPRWHRLRRAAAAGLAAAFIVLLPVAVTSAWIRCTVLSTSGYAAVVSNVAASPAVRAVIQEAVTAEADAVLPRGRGALGGPLRTGPADLAGKEASAFMASPAFQRLWAEANEFAHAQLISVLNGNSTLVPVIAIPAACQVLSHVSSPACVQIPLFPAAALAGPLRVYRVLTAATWLALALTPLAFASALAVSPRRRRILIQMAAGGTLTLLLAMLRIGRWHVRRTLRAWGQVPWPGGVTRTRTRSQTALPAVVSTRVAAPVLHRRRRPRPEGDRARRACPACSSRGF